MAACNSANARRALDSGLRDQLHSDITLKTAVTPISAPVPGAPSRATASNERFRRHIGVQLSSGASGIFHIDFEAAALELLTVERQTGWKPCVVWN